MPWREKSPMKERINFLSDCRSGLYGMSELCERYGISRKTGYKWLQRVEAEGASGLSDRSRAPAQCPHRMTRRSGTPCSKRGFGIRPVQGRHLFRAKRTASFPHLRVQERTFIQGSGGGAPGSPVPQLLVLVPAAARSSSRSR
jgi:hypothetical protein